MLLEQWRWSWQKLRHYGIKSVGCWGKDLRKHFKRMDAPFVWGTSFSKIDRNVKEGGQIMQIVYDTIFNKGLKQYKI
jgi:hypothetical protein